MQAEKQALHQCVISVILTTTGSLHIVNRTPAVLDHWFGHRNPHCSSSLRNGSFKTTVCARLMCWWISRLLI